MTELFHSVAPVFGLGGERRGEIARDLARLEILESVDGMKSLVLWLVARGPRPNADQEQILYLDGATFDFGKELVVSIGPSAGERVIFRGKVSAIEARYAEGREPHVVVHAEDRLAELRMTRSIRTYEHQSDADIARTIAGEHGLTPDVDAEGPTYAVVQQWNQSDLAFLRERARGIQAEVWLDEDRLCFKSRGRRQGSEITLVQGGELIEVRVRADLAHQRTRVTVSGYDAAARDGIEEEAGEEAVLAEVTGGRTGPGVLQSAFGKRESHRVRANPLVAGEARAWARAEMLRRSRGFVTVSGVTSGTADLAVGSRITLQNVGAPFDGAGYHAIRVCHTYDLVQGHRTHFDAERPTVNAS